MDFNFFGIEWVYWLGLLLFLMGIGVFWLFSAWIDGRYPKVLIRTKRKGTIALGVYRTMGNIIIADDIFGLLSSQYRIRGFLNWLDYYTDVSMGNKRVYEGRVTNDFIMGIPGKDITGAMPRIEIDGKLTKDGTVLKMSCELDDTFILPIDLKKPEANAGEDTPKDTAEIFKGKQIAEQFMVEMQANEQYIQGTNPLLFQIFTVLPFAIILIIGLAGMYFILGKMVEFVDALNASGLPGAVLQKAVGA